MKHKSRKRNSLIIIIVCIVLTAIAVAFWMLIGRGDSSIVKITSQEKTSNKSSKSAENTEPPVVHIVAMGDMLAHDTIIANATTETSYNFRHFFQNIRKTYDDADIVFCDQEGLSSGEKFGISGYPSFNAPTEFASDLQAGAGCNVVNLANNHMADKGVNATNATIDVWNNLKSLAVAGANKSQSDQNVVSYFTVKDIKFAFLAFADFNNVAAPSYSINLYHDEDLVRRLVGEARGSADVVMVSMHWGIEDSNTVSSDQINQANLLSSLGVDVIFGTGPHVLQRVDKVGSTVVWYSLGNMLSSQLQTRELIGGVAKFDVSKGSDGKPAISNLQFIPTYMHYEWTPAQKAAGSLLSRINAMIYPLSEASAPLSRSLLETTVEIQKQYITDTLGSLVQVQ